MAIPTLFNENEYIIDQKANLLKFGTAYNIFNGSGEQTGLIEQKVPAYIKLLSLFLNKASFPFFFEIKDTNGNVVAYIKRGWTLFASKVQILDESHNNIGNIEQKIRLLHTPAFNIQDSAGNVFATMKSSAGRSFFNITDAAGKNVGSIERQFQGVLTQMVNSLISKDRYKVTILPEYAEDSTKVAIVAGSVIVDMILREK